MSFARFASSGIYLFDDNEIGPVCWNCSLRTGQNPTHFATRELAAMLAHVAEHRAAGERIAAEVEQTLRRDWEDA